MNTQNPNPNAMLRSKYQNQWKGACGTLLLVTIFSIVNTVLCAIGSDIYFLFTAYFPYELGVLGMIYLLGASEFETGMATGVGIFLLSIAALVIIIYFVCWLFSRKKFGWLVAGTVLFSLDTVYMLFEMVTSNDPAWFVTDVIFHAIVLIELGIGVAAALKLKKLPADEIVVPAVEVPSETASDSTANVFDEIPKQANDQPGISDEFKK